MGFRGIAAGVATGLVVTALLGVAACGTQTVLPASAGDGLTFESGVPTWAVGSTLHVGETSYDVGEGVVLAALVGQHGALLETAASYADDAERTWSSFDGTALRDLPGKPDGPMLSPDGRYAAWIDRDGPWRPAGRIAELVVVDLTTGETVLTDHDHMGGGFGDDLGDRYEELEPVVVGFDDADRVFWRDAESSGERWRVDLATGAKESAEEDWQDGLQAPPIDGEPFDPALGGIVQVPGVDGATGLPGRPFAVDAQRTGRLRFLDAHSGERLPDLDTGRRFAFLGAWLGDDEVAVLATDDYDSAFAYDDPDRTEGVLMTCRLPTAACTAVADIDGLRHFVWGNGGWTFGNL